MLTSKIIAGLNLAFNEATLLGAEFDAEYRGVALTLGCISLNEDGTVPQDRRVQAILEPVGRIRASLRNAPWNDETAQAVIFEPENLLEVVQSFGGLPVYGWEFIDCDPNEFDRLKSRLSFDYQSGSDGFSHTLTLSQDGITRIFDLQIWFDAIRFFSPKQVEIPVENFIAAGERAWNSIMLSKDKKVQDAFGIYPRNEYKFDRKQNDEE